MLTRRAAVAWAMLVPLTASAQPIGQGANPAGAPAAAIAALHEALLGIMRAGKSVPFQTREQMLTPAVRQAFNLPLILQETVGLRYGTFSPAQQADLLALFTQFTVANYVSNFDSYNGEQFEIAQAMRHVGRDDVVQTRIVPTTGEPTRIDYVMRGAGASWKAIDVLLNGTISRVAVQRSDFRALVKTNDARPLIEMLRSKISGLETSTP